MPLNSPFEQASRSMTELDLLHTEEATGSIPVSPTQMRGHIPLMDVASVHAWVTNWVTTESGVREDLVHRLSAGQQDRSKFVAVDLLGDDGPGVTAEVGDVLEPNAVAGK